MQRDAAVAVYFLVKVYAYLVYTLTYRIYYTKLLIINIISYNTILIVIRFYIYIVVLRIQEGYNFSN